MPRSIIPRPLRTDLKLHRWLRLREGEAHRPRRLRDGRRASSLKLNLLQRPEAPRRSSSAKRKRGHRGVRSRLGWPPSRSISSSEACRPRWACADTAAATTRSAFRRKHSQVWSDLGQGTCAAPTPMPSIRVKSTPANRHNDVRTPWSPRFFSACCFAGLGCDGTASCWRSGGCRAVISSSRRAS